MTRRERIKTALRFERPDRLRATSRYGSRPFAPGANRACLPTLTWWTTFARHKS